MFWRRTNVMWKLTISVVDDHDPLRTAIMSLLRANGHTVHGFNSAEAFLASDQRLESDCVIVDMLLGGMNGLALHERLRADGAPIATVLMSGRLDEEVVAQALDAGVVCCLQKPFNNAGLMDAIGAVRAASGVLDRPAAPESLRDAAPTTCVQTPSIQPRSQS
jgi:FixJ family two-component response regulator